MAKVYSNLISTTAGFSYRSQQPIDDRLVVESYTDLDVLMNGKETYEGMIISVVNDEESDKNGSYQCLNNTWHKLLTLDNFDKTTGEKYLTSDNYRTRAENILNDNDYDSKTGNVILTKDNYTNENRAPEILTKNDILILEGGDAEFNPTTITTE